MLKKSGRGFWSAVPLHSPVRHTPHPVENPYGADRGSRRTPSRETTGHLLAHQDEEPTHHPLPTEHVYDLSFNQQKDKRKMKSNFTIYLL